MEDRGRSDRSEPFFPKFQVFVAKLFRRQAELLSWAVTPGENENSGSFRAAVFLALAAAGDEPTAFKVDPRHCPLFTSEQTTYCISSLLLCCLGHYQHVNKSGRSQQNESGRPWESGV